MPLKAKLQSLDGVAEAIAPLYRKVDAGQADYYLLDVEGVEGFRLENVDGLKATLAKERQRAETAESAAKAFGDLDPAKTREALAELEKMRGAGNVEERAKALAESTIKQLTEKHAGEIAKREEAVTGMRKQLETYAIDHAVSSALASAKLVEHGADLLTPHVKSQIVLKEVDGKLVPRVINPADGSERISSAEGSTSPMSVAELVAAMRTDKKYAPAFAADGGGSGATGTKPGVRAGNVDPNTLNPTQLMDLGRQQAAGAK